MSEHLPRTRPYATGLSSKAEIGWTGGPEGALTSPGLERERVVSPVQVWKHSLPSRASQFPWRDRKSPEILGREKPVFLQDQSKAKGNTGQLQLPLLPGKEVCVSFIECNMFAIISFTQRFISLCVPHLEAPCEQGLMFLQCLRQVLHLYLLNGSGDE